MDQIEEVDNRADRRFRELEESLRGVNSIKESMTRLVDEVTRLGRKDDDFSKGLDALSANLKEERAAREALAASFTQTLADMQKAHKEEEKERTHAVIEAIKSAMLGSVATTLATTAKTVIGTLLAAGATYAFTHLLAAHLG